MLRRKNKYLNQVSLICFHRYCILFLSFNFITSDVCAQTFFISPYKAKIERLESVYMKKDVREAENRPNILLETHISFNKEGEITHSWRLKDGDKIHKLYTDLNLASNILGRGIKIRYVRTIKDKKLLYEEYIAVRNQKDQLFYLKLEKANLIRSKYFFYKNGKLQKTQSKDFESNKEVIRTRIYRQLSGESLEEATEWIVSKKGNLSDTIGKTLYYYNKNRALVEEQYWEKGVDLKQLTAYGFFRKKKKFELAQRAYTVYADKNKKNLTADQAIKLLRKKAVSLSETPRTNISYKYSYYE